MQYSPILQEPSDRMRLVLSLSRLLVLLQKSYFRFRDFPHLLPFITEEDHEKLSFQNGDYIFVPDIRRAIAEKAADIKAYVVGNELKEVHFKLGDMTDAEREIILKGCLINYYRG